MSGTEIYFNKDTLRDLFAMMSPDPDKIHINSQLEQDCIANPHNDTYKPQRRSVLEIIAEYRYKYADAMLDARSNTKESNRRSQLRGSRFRD